MRFHLVDRILEWVPDKSIRAVKALSLAEEYLADHFPTFPVMPGVLMVEALVQAGAWLVRASRDFGPTVVVLREARNVVYGNFVPPGSRLETEVTVDEWIEGGVRIRGAGRVEGSVAVKGRLTLRFEGPVGADPARAEADARLRDACRRHFALLGGPAARRAEPAAV